MTAPVTTCLPFSVSEAVFPGLVPALGESKKLPLPTVKVLHIINGEHFSGAERVQQLLGKQLPDEGIAADFACLKPGKFPTHCDLPADRVFEFPMRNRLDWSVVRRLSEFVREKGYQVLHSHTPRSALVTGLVAKQLALPWVYHVHSPAARDSTRPFVNQINDWLESWCLRRCSRIITVSRSLRREMLRRGWDRHRIVTVANGVAPQHPIEPESRCAATWKLGMVALFRPRKGIEVLLQAMAKQSDRKVELEVIGGFETPEYQAQVESLIAALHLNDRVHLRGFTKDIPNAMRNLDAMVLPSLFGEGMPMVVLEALAVGVPVIATRVEGTPEVVRDGIEGVLANPQDPTSLANAIDRLTSDRAAWCRMSHQAVARHRDRFSDSRMAQRTARVYRSMV